MYRVDSSKSWLLVLSIDVHDEPLEGEKPEYQSRLVGQCATLNKCDCQDNIIS
jgi:hypothetical protein